METSGGTAEPELRSFFPRGYELGHPKRPLQLWSDRQLRTMTRFEGFRFSVDRKHSSLQPSWEWQAWRLHSVGASRRRAGASKREESSPFLNHVRRDRLPVTVKELIARRLVPAALQ